MEQTDSEILKKVLRYLACPDCHSPLEAADGSLRCVKCDFVGAIEEDVVIAKRNVASSFFDDKHQVMAEGNQSEGNWELFYAQQVKRVENIIPDKATVLDVGCGPEAPYSRQRHWFLIGLDPSFDSVKSNKTVDLKVYGTAESLPLADRSIDAVMCFYSVHHMTGQSVSENRAIVGRVFKEFGRIIRPGGNLLVFDLSPWWPFSNLENATWNLARRSLGPKLDMFFWEASGLRRLGNENFPHAALNAERFATPLFTTFPPIFSIPSIKIPRLLYPFEINLYNWQF